MSLVQYSDSSSEDDDTRHAISAQPAQSASKAALKRKRTEPKNDALPSLPAAFHDLYASNARVSTSDDPSLHGGRRRAVPHIEGNWPSHVYLEWIPSQTESDSLHNLIQHVKILVEDQMKTQKKRLPTFDLLPSLRSDLGASLPLHVSLSRTLQIKTEDRQTFVETLQSSLRRAAVRAFHFSFAGLKWVPNYERNRWFLVLSIKKPEHDELNRLLTACNRAAQSCGHPALYIGGEGDGPMQDNINDNPKRTKRERTNDDHSEYFHVSIAWNLAEPDPEWISLVQDIDLFKHIQDPEASFDSVKARVGNVVHNIGLATKRFGLEMKDGSLQLGLSPG